MKKLSCIAIALLFVLSAFTLVSCTEGEKPIEVPSATLSYAPGTVYENNATASNLQSWFRDSIEMDDNFQPIMPSEFALIGDYVLRMPIGRSSTEINIFKVTDEANIATVKALAEYRKSKVDASDIRLYDTNAADRLPTAQVVVAGNFVMYICTANTNVSVLRAQAFIQSTPDCTAIQLFNAIVLSTETGIETQASAS